MTSRNVFRGMFDALVEARTRQAAAYVRGPLSMVDGEDLRRAGFTSTKRER
ncbi:hypothetical protein [Notoacmeibacter ruber]|uniref:hypothetical protein n=1 Tax=Notoacmeibacter ruber TaxID=2670375 RepID=UPI0018F2981D|nr:hypothetical protein [Notoacmeibacter ruber]